MTFVDFLGWAAALTTFAAFSMKTMLPLRFAAVASNLFFISYGALSGLLPVLALHLALLPFNVLRIYEILRLIRRVRKPGSTHQELGWLRDLMRRRSFAAGQPVFRKGDPPDAIYYLEAGVIRLDEIGVQLTPGEFFGEIAFFSDSRQRTLSATCVTACRVLSLDEHKFLSLYYHNPEIGLAIIRLITRRLLDGMAIAPQAYVAGNPAAGAFDGRAKTLSRDQTAKDP